MKNFNTTPISCSLLKQLLFVMFVLCVFSMEGYGQENKEENGSNKVTETVSEGKKTAISIIEDTEEILAPFKDLFKKRKERKAQNTMVSTNMETPSDSEESTNDEVSLDIEISNIDYTTLSTVRAYVENLEGVTDVEQDFGEGMGQLHIKHQSKAHVLLDALLENGGVDFEVKNVNDAKAILIKK